jgi:hypothetical protein
MKMALFFILILLVTGYLSCRKAYKPALNSVTTNFLAIDGPIISGDSTFIKLSRTTSLSDTTQIKAELKAIVSVEDDQHKQYPLTETGKGNYVLGVTNFDVARTYRLDIKTSDGKIYQSDFVPMKVTPPIDSLYFKQTGSQIINFYVNTHDATNSTRYYRWDYKETWSYVSCYAATFQYKNGTVVPIVPRSADDISTCYQSAPSNEIFIGNSVNLTKDIITAQSLGALTGGSIKIAHIYAMQVHQYAITGAGFNYYQNLKNNTENLGSIFDAQPSTTNGNIHCITSPGNLVLGFVSVSTVAGKQFNLHYNDLQFQVMGAQPRGLVAINYFAPPDTSYCSYEPPPPMRKATGIPWPLDFSQTPNFNFRAATALASGDSLLVSTLPICNPTSPDYQACELRAVTGYCYAPKTCVDCRLKGGTNIRPTYFPAN